MLPIDLCNLNLMVFAFNAMSIDTIRIQGCIQHDAGHNGEMSKQ